MYTDYGVVYESNINEFIVPILIGLGILILIAIISLVAMMWIFKKANRSGIAALVPVYNIIVMFEIVNKPIWQILLLFVPILNIIISFDVLYKIAKSFRKTNTFAICTVLFPFIFLPIIGFSDSEYMGINKEAMAGNSVAVNIPGMNESIQDNEPVIEKKEAPIADISIGGGVYQKDYENSLLTVPDVKNTTVSSSDETKKVDLLSSNAMTSETPLTNSSSINNIQNNNTGIDLFNNVDFIDVNSNNQSLDNNTLNTTEVSKAQFNVPEPVPIPGLDIPEQPTQVSETIVENTINNLQQNIMSANENIQLEMPEFVPIPGLEIENTQNQSIISETSVQNTNNIMENPINDFPQVSISIDENIQKEPLESMIMPGLAIEEIQNQNSNSVQLLPPDVNNEINNNQIEVPEINPISEVVQTTKEIQPQKEFKLSSNMNESDYVSCSNCGAIVKKSAGRCFMCGKEI